MLAHPGYPERREGAEAVLREEAVGVAVRQEAEERAAAGKPSAVSGFVVNEIFL